MKSKKNKFIQKIIKGFTPLIIITLFASLLNSIIDLLVGVFIKNLTDSAIDSNYENSSLSILFILVLVLLGSLSSLVSAKSTNRFSLGIIKKIRETLVYHLEELPLGFFTNNHSGNIVNKFSSDMNIIQTFFKDHLPRFLYDTAVFILTFSYLFYLNWKLLLVTLISVPITIIIANTITKPMKGYAKTEQKAMDRLSSQIEDAAGGMYIEKAYNLTGFLNNKFRITTNEVLEIQKKRQIRIGLVFPFTFILNWLPLVTCAIYGGSLAFSEKLTPGSLFAFVYLLNFLIKPLSSVPDKVQNLRTVSVSFGRLAELLNEEKEKVGGESFPKNDNILSVKNLSFSYGSGENVLEDINFEVKAGSKLAIVGGSGCGKSTLLNVICGFYPPKEGDICLYGHNYKGWNIKNLRENISVVSQDSFLFPTTIAENIAIGKYGASEDEITNAAKLANAHDFIMDKPQGYNFNVGERGINLSDGQKQRISLARAILKGSPLLLLDEPTSALDTQSEALIQESLETLSKDIGIITVAHRLSTIKDSDEILLISNGRIEERGTHTELLSKDALYKNLYAKQC